MKNFGEFFNDQIETASCIVFSHSDKVSSDKLDTAYKLVREHNAGATIVTTSWNELSGKEILSAMEHSQTLESELGKLEDEPWAIRCIKKGGSSTEGMAWWLREWRIRYEISAGWGRTV